MRVMLFGNNRLALRVADFLRAQHEDIVGLVLHPIERRRFGDEIISAAGIKENQIFDATTLDMPQVLERIGELRPEIGISALFGYILREPCLRMMRMGIVNLHPAHLPYNRGANPNIWPIIDGTPAGATVHYIDAGLDTGDIIGQKSVTVEAVDTGETLYQKLEDATFDVFVTHWASIRSGRARRLPQSAGTGTAHKLRDVGQIDEIHLDQTYTAAYLINVLRARTFPPYRGAYFHHDGRKVFVRVQLTYEEDTPEII